MNDSLNLYVATRHMPPLNSGGPGAAARLLLNAIDENTGGSTTVKCKLLVGGTLLSSSRLHTRPDTDEIPSPAGGPWQWLENRPRNLALNAAHKVSLAMQSARLWRALAADLQSDSAVTIAFGSSMGQILTPNRQSARVKVILSEHSKGGASKEYAVANPDRADSLLARRMRGLESKTVRLCDRVIFPSQGAVDLFAEAHPEIVSELKRKTVVIHNGIPDPYIPSYANAAPSEPVILNVAQHVREKGIMTALEGALAYFATGASGRFHNFGASTPLTPKLETHIASSSSASRFELKGTTSHPELLTAMRDAWVVVSTPEVAVFDLIVLEAMALAKPLIVTPVGGNVEALGADYPLYAADARELTLKLQILHSHPEKAREIGMRNRTRFLENFTTKSFLTKHIDLCRDLSTQAGRP